MPFSNLIFLQANNVAFNVYKWKFKEQTNRNFKNQNILKNESHAPYKSLKL